MYAVVAPGLKGIYEDYRVIERIVALYPYAKFRKFETEDECWEFIKRNENTHSIDEIRNFGDTFNQHRVVMDYIIRDNIIYYNYNTRGLGTIRLSNDKAIVENRVGLIKARLDNVIVDSEQISGHIIAIYQGIRMLGEFVDVEVVVPDHSVFYAIRSYTGNNRAITRLSECIRSRLGNVSVTLKEGK